MIYFNSNNIYKQLLISILIILLNIFLLIELYYFHYNTNKINIALNEAKLLTFNW